MRAIALIVAYLLGDAIHNRRPDLREASRLYEFFSKSGEPMVFDPKRCAILSRHKDGSPFTFYLDPYVCLPTSEWEGSRFPSVGQP